MSITTFSVFYKNITVDSSNNYINFKEGGGAEITTTISPGTYALSEIVQEIKTAMDSAGLLTYTVTLDRLTRKVTIASTSSFDLLVSTGSQSGTSIFSSIGFTGSDRVGLTSYEGDIGASSEYRPQFILQDYVDSKHFKEKISPTVNESASGQIEVLSFGTRSFFEMSFKFITDKPMDGKVIKNNPSGVNDFISFMDVCIEKGKIEFMPDINDRNTFYKLILESTSGNSKGTGYVLNEMLSQNLPGIYELNKVKFRVVS